MSSPFDLTGKVAIITGSSRGIGRSIAETMASLGARVVVSSRKIEACEPVVEDIRESGGEAIAMACNISRKAEVEALVTGTRERLGPIDILVCNAAVNPVYGPMSSLSDEAFDKIMGANVKSNLWLCNLVIPEMAERGGGAVVIVSSIAGIRGTGVIGGYGISKAADFALARNLAVEWGPQNVRINCIAPGLIKTDFARALWEDRQVLEQRNTQTPLRRIGTPDEIGPVAAFLASSAASFMTGQTVIVDGGVTIA
ncbi:SDR family oxidoreductase [Microvirga sp. BT689]|uniref:SDR family NAD(P)-dependent oxidoreductase n=1 Tax=Microvirga arvi TaxID=2778731 RepID=UPI001951E289|nr:SDR family oxidoreductase [Microvirga arvi]MBM6579088.1 SDR family oxidoreductase [Microvirga arvi]